MNDPIGEIPIVITGDFSDLNDSIDQAKSLAQSGGSAIAESFSAATSKMMDFDEAAKLFAADGMEFDTTAKAAALSTKELGDIVKYAAQGILTLDDALTDFANSAGAKQQADALAAAFKEFADTAGTQLPPAISAVNDEIKNTVPSLQSAATSTFGWTDALKILGVSFSAVAIKDFVVDTLEAYAAIEKASVAIAALTGDSNQAALAISGLKDLAVQDALSFPSLLTAEQRMLAFGFSAQAIPGALRSIADAAAATGRSFDSVANSFERIVETGVVQSRTLVQLGINLKDLAAAMGVTQAEAKKAFAELDQSERILVLDTALLKFKGDAELVAQTLGGQWTSMGTEFTLTMQSMGEALAPFAEAVISGVRGLVIPALNEAIQKFKDLSDAIVSAGHIVDELGTPISGLANKIFGVNKTLTDLISGPLGKFLTISLDPATVAWETLFRTIQYVTHTGPEIDAMSNMAAAAANKLRDSANGANGAFQAWLASTGKMPAAAASVADAQEKANEKAIAARQAWLDLVDAYNKGLVGSDAVARGLKEYQSALQAADNGVKSHVLSLADLTTKENTLTEDVQKALGVWVSARTAYERTGDGVAVLNAAYSQLTKALKAAKEGFEDLNQTIIFSAKTQSEAFSQWQKGYSDALAAAVKDQEATQKGVQALAKDFNTLATNLNTYATNTTAYAEAYNTIQIVLKKLEDGLDKAGMSADDLDLDLVHVGQSGIPVITGGATKIQDAFGKVDPVVKDVNDRIAALGQTTTGTIPVIQGGTTRMVALFGDVKKAVDNVNTDVEDLGASIPTMAGKFKEGLFTVTDGLSKVTDSTHGVQGEFKITTEKGTVEWGNVSTAVDAVSTAASKATSNIIIMKGGILDATKNHKDLNDTASQLPTILNADATTMERVNSLIVQAGEATQKWATFTEQVAAAAKSAADSFAAFEQAAEDRMSGNARGGTVIPGATFKPGGITQATGSAGAELGSGLVPVNAPDALGTIGGGSPPPGMKWNANHTGFIPDIVWVNGIPYPAGKEPTGAAALPPVPAPVVPEVQEQNAKIRQMFEDMVNAGIVDVGQLNALAAVVGEFVTVDAQGLHISWQQATQAITTTTTATNNLGSSADKAGGIIAGFGRDTAAAAITLIPLPEKFASLGVAIAEVTDAMKAEYQTRLTLTEQMNQKIDQLNAAGDASLAAAWASNPNQRFGSKSPIPHLLPPTMPTNPSNQQIFGNGVPFLRDDTGGGGTTITINNPIVRGPGDVDALVQQLRNLGV